MTLVVMRRFVWLLLLAMGGISSGSESPPDRYLAFQIFTASPDSAAWTRNFPPPGGKLAEQVDGISHAIGTAGSHRRKLGFILGPLAFDNSDEDVRQLMRDAFAIALEKNVAVGFHVDDSMFWERRSDLNKPENIEWLDWNKTPNTGRRLDWSSTPTKIMPQLCLNSPAVVEAVKKRAAVIGEEAVRGMKMLQARGRAYLFIGVFAGWETQMGRDFDTGKYLGYHALMNEGYSAANPHADIDEARVAVVGKFVDLWAAALAEAGVPDEKIYSHIAFMSRTAFDAANFGQPGRLPSPYLETINFTPPAISVGAHHRAGFSTYPQFGLLEQIQAELAQKGNPPWAAAEGTAADPAVVEKGGSGAMESYLGNLYGRGAVVVNVFGWGVGPASNPFRKIAEGPGAITAYQKFLQGEDLTSDPPAQLPSLQFFDKMRKLQKELPPYLAKNGSGKVGPIYEKLGGAVKEQRYGDAEKAVDEIFQAITP